jgi:hypothetical protein
MAPKGVHQGPDAAPADKRHDDVDRIRRWDLGPELVPDGRLARCVREDSRVKERRERALYRLCSSVRKALQQRNQDTRRIERFVSVEIPLSTGHGRKATRERGSDSYRLVAPFTFGCSVNRSRHDAREVSRNSIRGLSIPKVVDFGHERRVKNLRKQFLKPVRQQRLMQTWLEKLTWQDPRSLPTVGFCAKGCACT